MRTLSSLAFFFYVLLATAQEPYLPFKTLTGGYDLEFPVFSSKNPAAAQNINYVLQLSELAAIDAYYKDNIFENVMPDEEGFGSYDIYFEVKENSPRVLSVRFNLGSCGGTCNYWTNCYNFNPQTGEAIQLGDLFTADGLEQFNTVLNNRWASNIDVGMKGEPAEDVESVQEFKACFEDGYNQLENFYVIKDSLVIDAENCLHKNAKFYDIDTQLRFSIKELTPLLNDYGRAVLGVSAEGIANFKSEYLLKEIRVYRNKENDAILVTNRHNEFVLCYYADTKEGLYYTAYSDVDKEGFLDDTIEAEINDSKASVYYLNPENDSKKPAVLLMRE